MTSADFSIIPTRGYEDLPRANPDFDNGAGEFNVSKKYIDKGWLDIALKNQIPNGEIVRKKSDKIMKEWWE